MIHVLTTLRRTLARRSSLHDDAGFSTAELLGNAALAIAALVLIWGGMQSLGVDVVTWMRSQLLGA